MEGHLATLADSNSVSGSITELKAIVPVLHRELTELKQLISKLTEQVNAAPVSAEVKAPKAKAEKSEKSEKAEKPEKSGNFIRHPHRKDFLAKLVADEIVTGVKARSFFPNEAADADWNMVEGKTWVDLKPEVKNAIKIEFDKSPAGIALAEAKAKKPVKAKKPKAEPKGKKAAAKAIIPADEEEEEDD